MAIDTINQALAFLTVLADIGIVALIVYIAFLRKKYPALLKFISDNILLLSFILSLVATCGSLYFSNIAGYTPCILCWYQRICMYPLVVLFGWALVKKDKNIVPYALLLAIIGLCISAYQNFYSALQLTETFCSALMGVSCLNMHVIGFGYVTIPVMALTAFLSIIGLILASQLHSKTGVV